jgi:hypothetical protein
LKSICNGAYSEAIFYILSLSVSGKGEKGRFFSGKERAGERLKASGIGRHQLKTERVYVQPLYAEFHWTIHETGI